MTDRFSFVAGCGTSHNPLRAFADATPWTPVIQIHFGDQAGTYPTRAEINAVIEIGVERARAMGIRTRPGRMPTVVSRMRGELAGFGGFYARAWFGPTGSIAVWTLFLAQKDSGALVGVSVSYRRPWWCAMAEYRGRGVFRILTGERRLFDPDGVLVDGRALVAWLVGALAFPPADPSGPPRVGTTPESGFNVPPAYTAPGSSLAQVDVVALADKIGWAVGPITFAPWGTPWRVQTGDPGYAPPGLWQPDVAPDVRSEAFWAGAISGAWFVRRIMADMTFSRESSTLPTEWVARWLAYATERVDVAAVDPAAGYDEYYWDRVALALDRFQVPTRAEPDDPDTIRRLVDVYRRILVGPGPGTMDGIAKVMGRR